MLSVICPGHIKRSWLTAANVFKQRDLERDVPWHLSSRCHA